MEENQLVKVTEDECTQSLKDEGMLLVNIRLDKEKFRRVKDTPKNEALKMMCKRIGGVNLYRNQQMNDTTLSVTASLLLEEIVSDTKFGMPSISWAEISYVFRKAARGDYENFFGINTFSLYNVLKQYCLTEGNEAQREANAIVAKKEREAIEGSPISTMIKAIASEFTQNHKQNGNLR